jgi:hypothetical protein
LGFGFGFYGVFVVPIPVVVLNTHRKRSPLLFFYKKQEGWCFHLSFNKRHATCDIQQKAAAVAAALAAN